MRNYKFLKPASQMILKTSQHISDTLLSNHLNLKILSANIPTYMEYKAFL